MASGVGLVGRCAIGKEVVPGSRDPAPWLIFCSLAIIAQPCARGRGTKSGARD